MNIKNVVLGIAIMILTIFVIVYGVNTFYERPEYDDYCGEDYWKIDDSVQTEYRSCLEDCDMSAPGEDSTEYDTCVSYCEGQKDANQGIRNEEREKCSAEYEEARETYSRNLFLMTLPLGIILIVIGVLVFGLEVVGAGLAGGGVGTLLWGIGEYWRYGSDLLKFLLSLVGLVAVVLIAYWFNKRGK